MTNRNKLMASTIFGGSLLMSTLMATVSYAQDAVPPAEEEVVQEVVVTGSRIRRVETRTSAPLTMIDAQAMTDRGVTQAGDILNISTSVTPSYPVTDGSGAASGSGQQYPNLFGMGKGRTLTLVNGRRFVASEAGREGNAVDTNMIPVGLIKRIDIVPAGGAAVYGSDAIAGVVNYVLKDDFEGAEFDIQYGQSSRGDYNTPSLRATFGHNFDNGKGNIAFDAGWSKTDPLYWRDRPTSNLGRLTVANSANTSESDGIPSVRENFNSAFWVFNTNGVLFTTPAPVPQFLLRNAGVAQQFTAAGGIQAYDPGTIAGIPFASGGQGFDYRDLTALRSGTERRTANLVGHYDLTDRIKISAELSHAEVDGLDPIGTYASNTPLNGAATGSGVIAFTRDNAFLTPEAITSLSAIRPAFAGGAPLFLSKMWDNLLPSGATNYKTETTRALVSLAGDFDFANRNFYWDVSYSHGVTEGSEQSWGVITQRYNKAINARRNGAGEIVCAVNADTDLTNDDAACAPINPFGAGNVSEAGRNYVSTEIGQEYKNTQKDFLATLGGDVVQLPGGMMKFSVAYERREEEAEFNPLPSSLAGLTGSQVPTLATKGSYNTNEYSAEVLVPIVGGDFTLPLVKALDFNGAYRRVDNSLAGEEDVWAAGLRWQVTDLFALRASRSRNFRAPTLTMILAPTSTDLGNVGQDPCDFRYINGGPAPSTRLANCQAEWTANGYGDLSTFQNSSTNFDTALVTTGGNRDLKNEVSDTTTYGFVFQPTFVPGLTLVVDRIEVDLQDGLSVFEPQNFMFTCYDSSFRPDDVCATFIRDATGQVVSATSTTYNAGLVEMRGETYNLNYNFPLGRFFGDRDLGRFDLGVEATHISDYVTSVTGFDLTRSDGTLAQPEWSARYDVNYVKGPLRVSYSASYLSAGKVDLSDNVESKPVYDINSNLRHNLSAQYELNENITVRGGVINLTDEEPSYPTLYYGDIVGRQYYVGLKAKF
ncbi:TonB-dependent receptor [Asticcacaulis sp. ZE23SCel15]|uniref:TonB-dependent receptor domain-containing protein n=1 Tax=Asticcacaulis sp. ZE23SCel15 TaxID=3059027 RepID=UPI00265E239D|nr:TonB-dependent receptor [Asticcacaulis sp. ZE23SCel15]WKL57016.1 TonB-dependent receptor [Asticcacaulis sp. ZE23SCel15]